MSTLFAILLVPIPSGINRSKFENQAVTFDEHTVREHNMWHYLYFVVHLRIKDKTEFTGPESYVYSCIKEHIDNKVSYAAINNISRALLFYL